MLLVTLSVNRWYWPAQGSAGGGQGLMNMGQGVTDLTCSPWSSVSDATSTLSLKMKPLAFHSATRSLAPAKPERQDIDRRECQELRNLSAPAYPKQTCEAVLFFATHQLTWTREQQAGR